MNSNQRSETNNQSSNGGNEKSTSSGRPATERDDLGQSQQSGTPGGARQGGQDSSDRSGSQTGNVQQGDQGQRQSNDAAGGLPASPGGKHLAADDKMDDDTGLSNTANRQSAQQDQGNRQAEQSNVGRRDDMTPD